MRFLCALALLVISTVAHAAAWKNETFGCQATLPDSAGWQNLDAPSNASSTVLVAMLHAQRGSAFGINVIHDFPSANLKDPATTAAIEKVLQALGYQFIGKSTITMAGREWLQYPVRSAVNGTSGVMRYTSANNQVYVVSLLRTGGLAAAQDAELQNIAASVRVIDLTPAAPVAVAPATTPKPETTEETKPVAPTVAKTESKETTVVEEYVMIGPVKLTKDQFRMGMYGIGGLLVLLFLLKILGGGSKPKLPHG